jgi:hypothetical protein
VERQEKPVALKAAAGIARVHAVCLPLSYTRPGKERCASCNQITQVYVGAHGMHPRGKEVVVNRDSLASGKGVSQTEFQSSGKYAPVGQIPQTKHIYHNRRIRGRTPCAPTNLNKDFGRL